MREIYQSKTLECVNAQRFEEALIAAANWAAFDDSAEASYFLGLCHFALGRPQQAVGFLGSALHKNERQRNNEAHRNSAALLALCHFQQRNMTESREWLDRVHQMEGALAEPGLPGVASISAMFKDFPRAREYAEQLVELRPRNPDYWARLANICNYQHQAEEAKRASRKALELSPHHFDACYALSQFGRATPEHNHLELFHSAFNENSSNPQARFLLGTALGKEYEDLGEYDEAFRWLDLAMTARFGQFDPSHVDRDRERKLTEDVATAFAGIDRSAVTGFPSRQPIFIVGMPRTGTTLLEQIIGSREDIHVAGELDDFDFALWKQLDPDKSAGTLNRAFLENASQLDFQQLGADYIKSVAPRLGKCRHWIDKKPFNFLNAGYIALALPEARILCLKRNAMDTCFANFKQAFPGTPHPYSYRQEDVARYYLAFRKLMEFWREQFPGRILEVSYEDLASDPEATSQQVFEHIGLEWTPDFLSFHQRPKASGSASCAQVRRPVYASSIGRWKHFRDHLAPMREVLDEG